LDEENSFGRPTISGHHPPPSNQSRLRSWNIGLKGFKERPILGWGIGNYNVVFNKHYDPWYLIKGEMKKRSKVRELIEHPFLPELILLARWDHMGRNPNIKIEYDKEDIINRLNKCANKHFSEVI